MKSVLFAVMMFMTFLFSSFAMAGESAPIDSILMPTGSGGVCTIDGKSCGGSK